MQFPAGFTPELINAGAADGVAMKGDAAVITTKALTLAALTAYTFTIQSSLVKPTSVVFATCGNGSNTQGVPAVNNVTVAATQTGPGTITVVFFNDHPTQALNGTLTLMLAIFN